MRKCKKSICITHLLFKFNNSNILGWWKRVFAEKHTWEKDSMSNNICCCKTLVCWLRNQIKWQSVLFLDTEASFAHSICIKSDREVSGQQQAGKDVYGLDSSKLLTETFKNKKSTKLCLQCTNLTYEHHNWCTVRHTCSCSQNQQQVHSGSSKSHRHSQGSFSHSLVIYW